MLIVSEIYVSAFMTYHHFFRCKKSMFLKAQHVIILSTYVPNLD